METLGTLTSSLMMETLGTFTSSLDCFNEALGQFPAHLALNFKYYIFLPHTGSHFGNSYPHVLLLTILRNLASMRTVIQFPTRLYQNLNFIKNMNCRKIIS